MRAPVLVVFVLLSVVFSGCTDDPAGDPEEPAGGAMMSVPDPASYFPIDNTGASCNEGFVVNLVSFEQAAAHLPPGFTAIDAAGLFGLPVPTGSAAVIFTVFNCGDHAYGNGSLVASDLGILVAEPTVEGVNGSALVHFYVVHTYTNVTTLVDAYRAVGYNHTAVEPAITLLSVPVGAALVSGDIYGPNETLVEYRIDGAKPDTFSTVGRFWQVVPGGVVYTHYELDAVPIAQGGVQCTIHRESLHAEVMGRANCPAQSTLGMALIGAGWTSEIVYLPGATVA